MEAADPSAALVINDGKAPLLGDYRVALYRHSGCSRQAGGFATMPDLLLRRTLHFLPGPACLQVIGYSGYAQVAVSAPWFRLGVARVWHARLHYTARTDYQLGNECGRQAWPVPLQVSAQQE